LNLERAASHGTRALGVILGARSPHLYVIEFPKSGGSWLADMIATYAGLPRPDRSTVPTLGPAVIHGHWPGSSRLQRVFYLHRDVRDVVISAYFRWLWEVRNPPYPQTRAYFHRRMPVLFHLEADDVRARLPQFIREFAKTPAGTRLSWSEHVLDWRSRPNAIHLGYEELLGDAFGTLRRVLPRHIPVPIDEDRLAAAVERNSFQIRARRAPGVADPGSFWRKGIAGDWRNHFSHEAGCEIDRHFGAELVLLGYEPHRTWWRDLAA
jgi:hypothetical protein